MSSRRAHSSAALPARFAGARGSIAPVANEADCVRRVRAGDEEAFRNLFHSHAADLCDYAWTLVRSLQRVPHADVVGVREERGEKREGTIWGNWRIGCLIIDRHS
jgi:hypothetical protein